MYIEGLKSSLSAYFLVEKNDTKFQAGFAKRKDFSVDVDYYKKNIAKVKTPDDLLKDRRLLFVTLSAFQLEDRIDAKALLKKLLTEDPTASTSTASKLTDQRFKAFANAFSTLKTDKGAKIQSTDNVATITKAYQTNEYEKMLGDTNPALREVLYFKRTISKIANDTNMTDRQKMLAIITDKTYDKVVVGALGLPESAAGEKASVQITAFKKARLDVSKLGDAAYVEKLAKQYLVNVDAKTLRDSDPTGGIGGLFTPRDNSRDNNYGIIDITI